MTRAEKMKAMWATPAGRARFMQHRVTIPVEKRFEAYVVEDGNGCHLWIGARLKPGYGFIGIAGKPKLATHVALEREGFPRPSKNHFALHRCDNPPCVNPDHLFWGTHRENMADQQAKGRHWATVKPNCKHGHQWTPENTRIGKNGKKNCRTCESNRLADRRTKRAARFLAVTTSEEKD